MHTSFSDHRDFYTHSALYQHAEHERRRTYARWFWAGGRATALDMYDTAARRCLTRFRLGAHGLEVSKAGWTNGGSVDRRNRLCKCCKMEIVEDEVHLIFECPMYDNLRQHYKSLFSVFSLIDRSGHSSIIFSATTEEIMQCFMGQPNQFLIAKFIGKCLLMRSKHMLG